MKSDHSYLCCKTCRNFIPHYYKTQKRYLPTSWGHCMTPRIKPRRFTDRACPQYVPSEPIDK